MTILLGILVFLVSFVGTAFAASSVTGDAGSLLDLAQPIFKAIMSGQYIYAAAAALVFLVAAARKYGAPKLPFLGSKVGGALLAVVGSFAGAVATALAAGAALSWGMVTAAGSVAFTAVGGFVLLKDLLVKPVLRPLMEKLSMGGPLAKAAAVVLQMVLWIFDKPDPDKEAKAAGDAAVAAKPGEGVAAVVDIKDVP